MDFLELAERLAIGQLESKMIGIGAGLNEVLRKRGSGGVAPAWTPASDVSGLLYGWWDINDAASLTDTGGGVISQINDKSGNTRHWSQATVGKQGTRTAANANFNNMGTLAVPSAGGYTPLSANIVSPSSLQLSSDGTDVAAGLAFAIQGAGVPIWNFGGSFPVSGVFSVHWDGGRTYGTGSGNTTDMVYLNGTAPTLFADGSSVTITTGGLVISAARIKSGGPGTYGRFIDEVTPTFMNRSADWARAADMDMGEFIILVGVVSDAVRQKYEGYLAWKWGLQGSLPAGHPYKNAAP